jgi:hypothetical protein
MHKIINTYCDELQKIQSQLEIEFIAALNEHNLELALRLIQQNGKILSYRDSQHQKEISCFHIPPLLNALVVKSAHTHTALFPQICNLLAGIFSIAGGVLGLGVIGASANSAQAFTAFSTGFQGVGGGTQSVGKIAENSNASTRLLAQHEVDEARRALNQTDQTERQSSEQEAKYDQMIRELMSQRHNLAQQILRRSSSV